MRQIRRLLIAFHITQPRNARCLHCGWLVPHVGSRQKRGLMAWEHWTTFHEAAEPLATPKEPTDD